jgi:hypothetical protein
MERTREVIQYIEQQGKNPQMETSRLRETSVGFQPIPKAIVVRG